MFNVQCSNVMRDRTWVCALYLLVIWYRETGDRFSWEFVGNLTSDTFPRLATVDRNNLKEKQVGNARAHER